MLTITQLDRHKILFLHQQWDSQRTISQKLAPSLHGVQHILKNVT